MANCIRKSNSDHVVVFPDLLSVNNSQCLYLIACDIESFGADCVETCGHCADIGQCSPINGTCLTGCDSGFQGDLCKTRKYLEYRCKNKYIPI